MTASLRHPYLSLRDTIAVKILALLGPDRDPLPREIDMAREIVDDLAEYARGHG